MKDPAGLCVPLLEFQQVDAGRFHAPRFFVRSELVVRTDPLCLRLARQVIHACAASALVVTIYRHLQPERPVDGIKRPHTESRSPEDFRITSARRPTPSKMAKLASCSPSFLVPGRAESTAIHEQSGTIPIFHAILISSTAIWIRSENSVSVYPERTCQ